MVQPVKLSDADKPIVGHADLPATQVQLVGDWRLREFATAIEGIPEAISWPCCQEVDEAYQVLQDRPEPPELIFLAQPLPGEVQQTDIDRLQQLVPLARIVVVVGTWCEGELRTGNSPSGVLRLYWYELCSWWRAALRRRESGDCPLWSMPLDHAHAGRWAVTSATELKLSVKIDAADFSVYETLAAALAEYQMTLQWTGPSGLIGSSSNANAGIWDGGQLSTSELQRLTDFCQNTNGPVAVLLDFPRVEHIHLARAAGADCVFAKPYVVEEIVEALASDIGFEQVVANRSVL